MHATIFGDNEIVDKLLRANANPNMINDNGDTALMLAVMCDNRTAFTRLLESGANPDTARPNGLTALALALTTWRNNNNEFFVAELLSCQLCVRNVRDLTRAALQGSEEREKIANERIDNIDTQNDLILTQNDHVLTQNSLLSAENERLVAENARLTRGLHLVEDSNQKLLQALQEVTISERQTTSCPICFTRTINLTLDPCGHCFCSTCRVGLQRCPICRIQTRKSMRIYIG